LIERSRKTNTNFLRKPKNGRTQRKAVLTSEIKLKNDKIFLDN